MPKLPLRRSAAIVLVALASVPFAVLALNTLATGFQIGSSAVTVDAHGVCQKVTTTDGNTYFVPTNTSGEWSAFRSNKPTGITLADCASVFSWKTDWATDDWATTSRYTGGSSGWANTGSALPTARLNGQIAVIGDYVYLFGGINVGYTNVIYRAPVSDPTSWANTGFTLPTKLFSSHLAIVGPYIYLFGGNTGSGATSAILRAPLTAL